MVRTWENYILLEVCAHAESAGQRVPDVELAALSRLVSVIPGSRLPLSIRRASPTLLRVLSDNRDDGRQFAFCREFSSDVFLRCFRQSHQEVFSAFETTSIVDFYLLRLKGVLQKPWLEDVPALRRAIVVGSVKFVGLRDVVSEFLSGLSCGSTCVILALIISKALQRGYVPFIFLYGIRVVFF